MGLAADISGELDAGAIVRGLLDALTDLAGPAAELLGFDLPIDPNQLDGILDGANGLDASAILGAVGEVAQLATPMLARIPGVGEVMGPITAALEVVEQISGGDMLGDLGQVIDAVAAELDGGAVDVLASLMRATEQLRSASAVQTVLNAALRLVGAGGRSAPPAIAALVDVLPALDATGRLFAGLTTLESVLAEAERITTIAADRLDAEGSAADFALLEACFRAGDLELSAWLDGLDPSRPADVRAGVSAVQACADRLERTADTLAASMAFGEASLAYLGVDAVLAEVQAAAAVVREADLAPGRRLAARLTPWVEGILPRDLARGAANPLDALLGVLEREIGRLAGELGALDPTVLTTPLTTGISTVMGVFDTVSAAITTVTTAIEGALGTVRDAITALPLERVAAAIRTVLDPITAVLDTIRGFVDGVGAAIDAAAGLAVDAMGQVEGLLDRFKEEVDGVFAKARAFVERLDLSAVVGVVREKIQAFADLIAKAQMKPYFDTAIGAVGTAAGVVEKIPFGLLPDSMKSEVDAAVAPIKQADVRGFSDRVQQTIGVGPEGFAFREDLEDAVAEIQAAYEKVIAALEEHNPRGYIQQLDAEFDALAERIRAFSPDLRLEPVEQAIETVKALVAGVDLNAAVEPLREVFRQVDAALTAYSPEKLIQPVEDRLEAARAAITKALRLDAWRPTVVDLRDRALGVLDLIDPQQLQPLLTEAFGLIEAALADLPDRSLGSWLGGVVAGLFADSDARLYPERFAAVLPWLGGESGTAALTARAERIAQAVGRAHDAVTATDVLALSAPIIPRAAATQTAARRLAAQLEVGEDRVRLEAAIPRLEASARLAPLAANRDRYLGVLAAARRTGETLRRTGLSEVDVALAGLREALSPMSLLTGALRGVLERVGITGLDVGVITAVRGVLAVLPPARLAGLLSPIFEAARGRVVVLLDAVIEPVLDGIGTVETLVGQLSVQPLIDAIAGIRQAILDEIAPLHPDALLGDALTSFGELQASVADFDPLGALEDALDEVKEAAARLLEKLSAERLLESPLAIYDHILQELSTLSLEGLLTPVLDQIDEIVKQVDAGLDGTVTAFERLQAALPGGGGGSSASASISVG